MFHILMQDRNGITTSCWKFSRFGKEQIRVLKKITKKKKSSLTSRRITATLQTDHSHFEQIIC